MTRIRLIALDMDGTLTNSQKIVTERTKQALRAASAAGIAIAACSGRTMQTLPAGLLEMPELDYTVACNGAAVYDCHSGERLYSDCIPAELALQVMEAAVRPDCVVEAAAGDTIWLNAADEQRELAYIPTEFKHSIRDCRTVTDRAVAEKIREWGSAEKILLFYPTEELCRRERERLEPLFPRLAWSSSLPTDIEINSPTAGKGPGLLALLDRLGLQPEELMVFGDAENDISMFSIGAINIAMGNACPEIKALADHVTATNDEDGVAVYLEKYLAGIC